MSQLLPSQSELDAHAATEATFARWRQGYGVIQHSLPTQAAAYRLAHQLVQAGQQPAAES